MGVIIARRDQCIASVILAEFGNKRSHLSNNRPLCYPAIREKKPLQLCLAKIIHEVRIGSGKAPPVEQASKDRLSPIRDQETYLPGVLYHIYEEIPHTKSRTPARGVRQQFDIKSVNGAGLCPASITPKLHERQKSVRIVENSSKCANLMATFAGTVSSKPANFRITRV